VSELQTRLHDDVKTAMKAKDVLRRDTIRMVEAAVKNAEIEKREPLDDLEVLQVVQKQIRQREDSVEQYRAGGRDDLADQEAAEIVILEVYVPQQMSREAIAEIVRATIDRVGASGAGDKGKIMGPLMGELRGKADGRLVTEVVTELLGE
jgi:uncharacterized protein YqeY